MSNLVKISVQKIKSLFLKIHIKNKKISKENSYRIFFFSKKRFDFFLAN